MAEKEFPRAPRPVRPDPVRPAAPGTPGREPLVGVGTRGQARMRACRRGAQCPGRWVPGGRSMLTVAFPLFPIEVPLAAYEWLVCYLLRETRQKLSQEKRAGSSDFAARNNCQVRVRLSGRPVCR